MIRVSKFAVLAVIALALLSGRAEADVIFSDLGPGDSFNANNWYSVWGDGWASGFTLGGSYNVSEIDVALAHVSGSNAAVVSLWTDVGDAPNTELGSWDVSPSTPITAITGITGVTLGAGGDYFVEIASDYPTLDDWNYNNQGVTGPLDVTYNGHVYPQGTKSRS
jgi:hypothetical protein